MNVLNEIQKVDEYIKYKGIVQDCFLDDINYLDTPVLKRGFNNRSNLLTLWFLLLKIKGTITEDEQIKLFSVSTINRFSEASDTTVDGLCETMLNNICKKYGYSRYSKDFFIDNMVTSAVFAFYNVPDYDIEKIKELFGNDNSHCFNEHLTFTYDEILSKYYSIPHYTDECAFMKINYQNGNINKYFFILFTPSNVNNLYSSSNFPGYYSKLMAILLTGFVRWGLPSLPEKPSDLPEEILEVATGFDEDSCSSSTLDVNVETSKGYQKLAQIINSLIDMSEINADKLRKLNDLCVNNQKSILEQQIRDCDSYIQQYVSYLNNKRRIKQEKQTLLMGLTYLPKNDSEFDEFSKLLQQECFDITINNSSVAFSNKGFLEEISGIPNLERFIKSGYNSFSENEVTLLKSVFINKKYKLQTFSRYEFDFNSLCVYSRMKNNNSEFYTSQDDAIPNPHHRYYGCLGDNGDNTNDLFSRGELYGALCTIMYATRGINLSDDAVWDSFRVNDIPDMLSGCYKDTKCFYNEELGYLTASQVIEIENKETEGEQ